MQYTRAPAHVRNEENTNFSMLDGKIVGKFLKLKPDEYIKMEWKFNDWS
jgi:activator of HSP90 ATPase